MNSNSRIITILLKLLTGEKLKVSDLATEYQTTIRTIQRDFSTIKKRCSEFDYILQYDALLKVYSLASPHQLDENKILVLSKILLESRALNTSETNELIQNLLYLTPIKSRKHIQAAIKNELTFFHSLQHKANLLEKIKKYTHLIEDKKVLEMTYQKNRGQVTERRLLPVSIFFSEYYFYVICYEIEKERYINLRLDRILKEKQTSEIFKIPHQLKLEESKLRKDMYFMYAGKETTFTFRFWGIVEAALDKLPNATIMKEYADHSVLIEATAQDTGIIMWLLSQGENVQVISPPSFVNKIKEEIENMKLRYDG